MIKNLKAYRPHLSPAMVVAMLALVVASSMPAQAAMERLAKGSVGTAQLKDGAVTTPKIRNGAVTTPKIRDSAVTGPKIRNGAVGLGDLAPTARPKLPEWRGSDKGGSVAIPSGQMTTVLTLALPAGHWFVFGKGIMSTFDTRATCDLVSGGQIWDRTTVNQFITGDGASAADTPMSLGQRVVLSRAGTVEIRCFPGSGTQSVSDTKLNAIRVRS